MAFFNLVLGTIFAFLLSPYAICQIFDLIYEIILTSNMDSYAFLGHLLSPSTEAQL